MFRQELTIVKGDTLELEISVRDNSNAPFSLQGAKIFFTVKPNPDLPDEQAVIQIIQTEHVYPDRGISLIVIPASQTANLSSKQMYYYDVRLVKNDKVYTLAYGVIKVIKSITTRIVE